jgi:uncharacterized protein (UPF0216 family)
MVAELIPNLKTAWIEPAQAEPVAFGDYVAPAYFSAWFIFNSPQTKSDKKQGISTEWDLFLDVTVSELGSPELTSVLVKGSRSTNLLQPDRQGVERWQLKVAEQYRAQLLTLALRVAIETRSPSVLLRREYSAENAATMRALTKAGVKGNKIVLEHPSTLNGSLPSGEVAEFVRFWDGNPNPLNAQELKVLQKLIGEKIRQKITKEILLEVAKIYTSEAEALGGKPVKAVQDHFGGSYRSAQDYVRKAREEGYLPQTTRGKVTIKHTRARKDKDDNKKQS